MADKRLIDANALMKKSRRMYAPDEIDSIDPIATSCVTVNDIHGAPTIDAVEVVRCGKCAYYNRVLQACCNGMGMRPYDFFCAYGEKRDGGAS